MADRDKIVAFTDSYLDSKNIKDNSMNGLQAEGREQVKKIAFGVSASLECIRRAAAGGRKLLTGPGRPSTMSPQPGRGQRGGDPDREKP